jgi:hypothetical protein
MSNGDFGRSREPVERHDPVGWPDGDGYLDDPELDDPESVPYPLTYERDGFDPERFLSAAAGQHELWPTAPAGAAPATGPAWEPWPDAPDPAGRVDDDAQPGEAPADRQPWRPGPPPPPDGHGGGNTAGAPYPAGGEPWVSSEPEGAW